MRDKIVAGNIYHILSRGVDKRKIFLNNEDCFRFIHDLFEFNDIKPANSNLNYYFSNNPTDVARPYIKSMEPRKLLVEILAFCLVSNHYHLLIKPRFDDGLFHFMKKLNGGYAKYFNEKYERTGALFEGRYKSIAVKDEAYFIHIPYYIHLNPLDLKTPEWRDGQLHNYEKAINFLESYRWNSHLDYIGKKNFPSVTQRDFLTKFFGGPQKYKDSIKQYLKNLDLEDIKEITLE